MVIQIQSGSVTMLREIWLGIRDTTLVVAQVVTLGVVALVLGLVALNALLSRPPAPVPTPTGPSRPLVALVPTIVASTPTARPDPGEPSDTPGRIPAGAGLYVPPGFASATAIPPSPTPEPTAPPPTATPVPAIPTPAAPTPVPSTPTPKPAAPTPTSAATGQMMKVLPASDGLPARVRAEPSARAPILVRVPLGASVEVLGTAVGDEVQPGNARWLRVRWKDTIGYIYSTLVG